MAVHSVQSNGSAQQLKQAHRSAESRKAQESSQQARQREQQRTEQVAASKPVTSGQGQVTGKLVNTTA